MNGVLFRIDDLENVDHMPMYTIPCDEMLLTPSIVFEYFKRAKKKYKIAGRRFTLLIGDRAYHIVKIRQAYRIYELGVFDGKLKAVDSENGDNVSR